MLDGSYLRKMPNGKYRSESTTISEFMERIVIDYQFSREGDSILNLQGGNLLGIFIPITAEISHVISSLEDNYGFGIDLE